MQEQRALSLRLPSPSDPEYSRPRLLATKAGRERHWRHRKSPPARRVPQIGAGSMIQKITNQIRVFRLERRSEVDSSPKVAKGLPIKRSTCLYYRLPVTVPKNADCFHKSGYRLYGQVSHPSSANTAILTRQPQSSPGDLRTKSSSVVALPKPPQPIW